MLWSGEKWYLLPCYYYSLACWKKNENEKKKKHTRERNLKKVPKNVHRWKKQVEGCDKSQRGEYYSWACVMCSEYKLSPIALIFLKVLAMFIFHISFLYLSPITTLESPFDLCVLLFNLIMWESCQAYDRCRYSWDDELLNTNPNTWMLRVSLGFNL